MLFKRGYADVAKARQLLKNAFQRMDKPDYKKSAAQRDEIIKAARELNVHPNVAAQAYEGATPASAAKSAKENGPGHAAAQRRAVQQADTEMFGPPRTEQFSTPDFQYDDLPSLAHLQLEEHRDVRQFVRVAAYELPLLAQYRSAYRRPTEQQSLTFKHFAFPNESDHPAASKVVLTFSPESTGLPKERLHTLKLLAGRRYDSVRNEVRISANSFGTQAQNKRYLTQIYERLVSAARDGEDAFADVPIDERAALRRQHKSQIYPSHKWPKEWDRPDLAPKQREDILTVLSSPSSVPSTK